MDFDSAIKAHTSWKMKLSGYIAKPDGSIRQAELADHRGCELGKWLHGGGTKFAALPEYATLKNEHARFHLAAGDVVRKADAGQRVSEQIALGSNSPYASASEAVVRALMAMKLKAH